MVDGRSPLHVLRNVTVYFPAGSGSLNPCCVE
jgi:hypothetical protein